MAVVQREVGLIMRLPPSWIRLVDARTSNGRLSLASIFDSSALWLGSSWARCRAGCG